MEGEHTGLRQTGLVPGATSLVCVCVCVGPTCLHCHLGSGLISKWGREWDSTHPLLHGTLVPGKQVVLRNLHLGMWAVASQLQPGCAASCRYPGWQRQTVEDATGQVCRQLAATATATAAPYAQRHTGLGKTSTGRWAGEVGDNRQLNNGTKKNWCTEKGMFPLLPGGGSEEFLQGIARSLTMCFRDQPLRFGI